MGQFSRELGFSRSLVISQGTSECQEFSICPIKASKIELSTQVAGYQPLDALQRLSSALSGATLHFTETNSRTEIFNHIKVFRTYALYKRIILCINANTLFQAFIKRVRWLRCDRLVRNRKIRLEALKIVTAILTFLSMRKS
ncbi:MAG: hypothetical protein V7K19_26930 [Nostoc sp.]